MILVITYYIICTSLIIIKEQATKIHPGALILDPESRWALGLAVPMSSLESWHFPQIPGIGIGLANGLEKLIAKHSIVDGEDPIATLKKVHGIGEGKARLLCRYFFAQGCTSSPRVHDKRRTLDKKQLAKKLRHKKKKEHPVLSSKQGKSTKESSKH